MEENKEIIKEAEIMEKEIIEKPEFKSEIDAKIVTIGKIEDNIEEVKKYAISLNEYYKNINKFKDKVTEFRKTIVEEYNKPIKMFENTAKETETLLKNTYETINQQVKKYNDDRKFEIESKLKIYFEEYKTFKNIESNYLKFEDLNINITLACVTEKGELTKKVKEEVNARVNNIAEQLETINTMQYADEILVEYLKDKNMNRAIKEVNDRHMILDIVREKKAEQEEQKITDEEIIKKIDSLTAPTVEEVKEEILELNFKVRGTKTKLKELKEFLNNGGYDYE